MDGVLSLVIPFAFFIGLICVGLFVGGTIERKHFQDLELREQRTQHMLVTQLKTFPDAQPSNLTPTMLVSETVISSDYLKSFLGGLRNIFGGQVKSFQTLLERGRREAILRLKEESLQLGYDAICNIRIDTADIGGRNSNKKKQIVMASILASGTAYSTGRQSNGPPSV